MVELRIGGQIVSDGRIYRAAISSFIAEGGDEYYTLIKAQPLAKGPLLSDIVMDYFRQHHVVSPPQMSRLVPVSETDRTIRMAH